jgi:amino acid transporter
MGPWTLAAGIVNCIIGGSIFRMPATMAGALGGAAPIAYVACTVAVALVALCYAEAGSRVSLTGGPYAYVEVAFGSFVGFLAGVLLWLAGTFALAAVSTLLADAVAAMAPAVGGSTGRAAVLGVVLAGLGWVNVLGVRQGARLNAVMTAAKILPLVLVIVAGALASHAANLAVGPLPSAASVTRASVVLIFSFAGVEAALVPSGEVRDPVRTVPRALAIGMLAVTAIYLAIQLVAQGVLGAGLAASRTPVADTAGVALGAWGRNLVLGGATLSMLAYVSGMILSMPRALFALARDGILPRRLAAVHATHRTPHVAIVAQAVVVWLLAATGTFEKLALLANVSVLLLYGACAAAAWELRRRDVRAGGVPFRVPLAGVVPALTLLVVAGLLTSVTLGEWTVVLGVIAAAALVYLFARARREAARATT